MKVYKARSYGYGPNIYPIEEMDADRITETSVFIRGFWHRRMSKHDGYFETYSDAREWLLLKANHEVNKLRERLKDVESQLEKISNL